MQYLKKEVRDKITKAAMTEFLEQGYCDASIRNIALTAETSLGNIYRYFSNKEALYLALVNPFIADTIKEIESNFNIDKVNLPNLSKKIFDYADKHHSILSMIEKGNSDNYQDFCNQIVVEIAKKISISIENDDLTLFSNEFFVIVASSFFNGVKSILTTDNAKNIKQAFLNEYVTFFFVDYKKRLNVKV